ncbi:MAG: hypothetical protein U0U67_05170 [Chitinophagales bacterium]
MKSGEIYQYKRTNFINKAKKYFEFLEKDFGFNTFIHLISKQPNEVIIKDELVYENMLTNKKIKISNAYHPVDYGFEINIIRNSDSQNEMLFFLLKEEQDIEQEYLKEYAEKLRNYLSV